MLSAEATRPECRARPRWVWESKILWPRRKVLFRPYTDAAQPLGGGSVLLEGSREPNVEGDGLFDLAL